MTWITRADTGQINHTNIHLTVWTSLAAGLPILLTQLGEQGGLAHCDPAEHLQHSNGSFSQKLSSSTDTMPKHCMLLLDLGREADLVESRNTCVNGQSVLFCFVDVCKMVGFHA